MSKSNMAVVSLTGLALNTTPNLSISYLCTTISHSVLYIHISHLAAAVCIISTAQHAKPKVIGNKELWINM